jgi:hypothetical protein
VAEAQIKAAPNSPHIKSIRRENRKILNSSS